MKYKKILICLIETVVVNIVSYFLFYVLQTNQDVYLALNPHPCFILSLIMGVRYGNVPGFLSAFISCFFYVMVYYELYHNITNIFIYFQYYKFLLMFIGGAIILGYIKDNFDLKIEKMKNAISVLTENFKHLYKTHKTLEGTQHELKKQIINSEESILHLYEIASKLETLDSEQVYTETIGILSKYLKADAVSIYSYIEGTGYLRLKVRIGQINLDNRSINIHDSIGFTKVVLEKRAIKWPEVNENNFPLMSAPIMKEDKVLAIVNIEQMDFDKLSEYAFQLFRLIVDWVNRALGQAIYVDELKESKYVNGTNWLRYDYFVERLNEEERRQKEFGMEYSLLTYVLKHPTLTYFHETLLKYLRSVDVVGYDDTKGIIFILLPATPRDNLIIVEERILSKLGNLLGKISGEEEITERVQSHSRVSPQQQTMTTIESSESIEIQADYHEEVREPEEIEEVEYFQVVAQEENMLTLAYQTFLPSVVSEDSPPVGIQNQDSYLKEFGNEEVQISEYLPEESNIETAVQSEVAYIDNLTAESLLIEGIRLSKEKNFPQAVRYFNKVLKSQPEQELQYLAVYELSSLYQHLGLYSMALDIISTFCGNSCLKNHPGMNNLVQKSRYIQCLTDLLDKYQYGQIPYEMIPEEVRKKAFINFLKLA